MKKQKKYKPVRVVNPIDENHLVPLHPNQHFILVVSGWMNVVNVDYCSDFFQLTSDETLKDGTRIFIFQQIFDLTDWRDVGSVYLGEVLLVGNQTASSLCVVLNSEMSDVLTVIKPTGLEVKVRPYQVIEVVLYDQNFEGKWSPQIMAGTEGITYKQVDYEYIPTSKSLHNLSSSSQFLKFPRALDRFIGWEHHYFFEYDVDSIKKIAGWKTGVYSGGRLSFFPNGPSKLLPENNILHIRLGVQGRHRNKLMCPKRLPDSNPSDIKSFSLQKINQSQVDKNQSQVDKNQSDYDDYDYSHYKYRYDQKPQAAKQSFAHSVSLPLITMVEIKERKIPETADPLYCFATVTDHNSVLLSKWQGKKHGYVY